MDEPVKPDVRVYPDLESLSRAVAESLVLLVQATVGDKGHFSMALSGGRTPHLMYRLLADEYRGRIPWSQVHLFWGDERYVPPDDPRSNYRMARESLLNHVPIPADHVHSMPTDLPESEAAARAYEALLRDYFPGPWPRFDLVLLGIGTDGHTASLFPGSPALAEQKRWVVTVRAPAEPPLRLTLTLPVLNHAAHVYFLVAGADKAEALHCALASLSDPVTCPASAVRPVHGDLVWWVDKQLWSRLLC